jgi:hypothetical protein
VVDLSIALAAVALTAIRGSGGKRTLHVGPAAYLESVEEA